LKHLVNILLFFFISLNVVHADSLIEQLKKCKPKVKNVYPEEYRDGGTHITTFTIGNYRFIMQQDNNNGENCGEIEKGHEFRFTAERKESKKGKYKPFQFPDLFKTEKVEEFNKVLQDSIQQYIQTSEYKNLIQDNPTIQGINECGYLFSKEGVIVIFNIGIDWEKAAKYIVERDNLEDDSNAYSEATSSMCNTGSFILSWEKMGEYIKD
jgi:hypothetical protein